MLLQVRHDSLSQLEKLIELPVQVQHKVINPFSLSFYQHNYDAIKGADSNKMNSPLPLLPFTITPLFISTSSSSGASVIHMKNPPCKLTPGVYFKGVLSLGDANSKFSSASNTLELFDVKLFIDYDLAAKAKTNGTAREENAKEEKDLIDLLIGLLSSKYVKYHL